eukprot:15084098-Alexandrium_andersonii.AAC.1
MLSVTAGASRTTGTRVSPSPPAPTAATGRQLPKAASWSPSTAANCARGTERPACQEGPAANKPMMEWSR